MRFRSTALLLSLAAVSACALSDSTQPSNPAEETFAPALEVDLSTMTKISDDLYYKDVVVGTGTPAAAFGKMITVYYNGFLKDGTKFDGNIGGDSLRIPLDSDLIAGWYVGIPGMKPGGTRKLVVGSSYGYGARGSGPIPPHATLVFDIQLKRVE
ncbi:MAG TPA: FKBP-type peptidyl-prolyl cis-trans isomerase [Gemmatimonadaceae bacterium]|nr:FKBP-type peptidyl-prolyl cis-trans isomerase [Gemmatimonadaceae bacterium]